MNVEQPSSLGSYPGGKSGSGIYQRLINLIPSHRVLVVPFAGHCGVVRNIRPAEQTIVIDRDPDVCEWWSNWRRTKNGRSLEIFNADGIEWVRNRYGSEYSAAPRGDVAPGCVASRSGNGSRSRDRVTPGTATSSGAARFSDARETPSDASEAFVFCDPPYVMSERATGKIYGCELTDDDHRRLLEVLTSLDASRYRVMVCGYPSSVYSSLDHWKSIDHRVPTRGGLQDERLWLNYEPSAKLHDYRFVGDCRRSRERIRRRQLSWREQLDSMSEIERLAMLESLDVYRKGLQ